VTLLKELGTHCDMCLLCRWK